MTLLLNKPSISTVSITKIKIIILIINYIVLRTIYRYSTFYIICFISPCVLGEIACSSVDTQIKRISLVFVKKNSTLRHFFISSCEQNNNNHPNKTRLNTNRYFTLWVLIQFVFFVRTNTV